MDEQYKFFMFLPDAIKEICDENGFNYSKVIRLISIFCCRVGSLKTNNIEEIYLHNPINDKFVILLEPGILFLPNINAVFMNLFEIFEKIIDFDNQDKQIYFEARTKYLERKTANIIGAKFKPRGEVFLNSQWDDMRHGENDCTLLYENYAIVFEDKSGRVNRNTYKGLLNSAYKDSKNLVEESSEQATLFANFLMKNLGQKLTLKVKGGNQNIIDLKNKNVLRLLGEVGLFKIIFGKFTPTGMREVGSMGIQSVREEKTQDILIVKFSAETGMVIETFLYFQKGMGKLLYTYFQNEQMLYKNVSELIEKTG